LVVADASVLIAFAKMRRMALLRSLYDAVLIGPVVKVETVDRGKAVAARGVEEILRGLDEQWIQLVRLTERERRLMHRILRTTGLDEGETEALALASSRGLTLLVDDKEARAMAAAMQLRFLGSAGALLEAYGKEQLTLGDLEEAVGDLTRVMWLSPTVATEILRRAREARK
jgi:predicted nucleic acid-binding protein